MNIDDRVCSEVHTFTKAALTSNTAANGDTAATAVCAAKNDGATPGGDTAEDSESILASFTFTVPQSLKNAAKDLSQGLDYDSDGDVVVVRRENVVEEMLHLQHDLATPLVGVGRQVWRGSLLLADYLLHNHDQIKDAKILELGSGTGLSSIIAAFCQARVTATDIDGHGILERIQANLQRNAHLVKQNSVTVRALDLFTHKYRDLGSFDVIIAGDLIYDDDITDAFLEFISQTLTVDHKVQFLVSLEKRYVFTVADLDTVAPAHDHFLNKLDTIDVTLKFLDTQFKQYFCYDRGDEMVLMKIKSK